MFINYSYILNHVLQIAVNFPFLYPAILTHIRPLCFQSTLFPFMTRQSTHVNISFPEKREVAGNEQLHTLVLTVFHIKSRGP